MPISNIGEGFLIRIVLEKVTRNTSIVRKLRVDFREEGKVIVNVDEFLKNLLMGFGTYIKGENSKVKAISSKCQG